MKIKNSIIYLMIIMSFGMILSGCDMLGPSVNLDEEETSLVSEYAAGVLVRHIKGNKMGLKQVKGLDYDLLNAVATPTPIPTPTPEPEPEVEIEVSEDNSESLDTSENGSDSEVIERTLIPMNEAFSLDGAELNYSYYELCDSYPSGEDDLLFAMVATEGNKLLVVHFNLTNVIGYDKSFQTSLQSFKVRGLINNTEKIRGELTLLPNDLASFSGVIPAGATEDVVLVYEVSDTMDLQSFDLMLIKGSEQMLYPLF